VPRPRPTAAARAGKALLTWPRPMAHRPTWFQPRMLFLRPRQRRGWPRVPVGHAWARTGGINDLPAGTGHRHGSLRDRFSKNYRFHVLLPGPDAVRYMSVHSWKQPDSNGHNGTSQRPKQRPASPGNPRPRAVFAGGGRCWVRTNVGLADGFTVRLFRPIGIPIDLPFLHSPPRQDRVLSVWLP
jgi:hypothetical protein